MENCWLYLQLWSPGSCFFLPHGARIYNKLMDFMRQQYRDRGYQEVYITLLFTQLDYRHRCSILLFSLCLSYRCWARIFTICNFGKLPGMLQTTRRTCLFLRYVHSQIIQQNLWLGLDPWSWCGSGTTATEVTVPGIEQPVQNSWCRDLSIEENRRAALRWVWFSWPVLNNPIKSGLRHGLCQFILHVL